MMCIPSIGQALWSWGLLLAIEGVVVVPLPTMACASPEDADGGCAESLAKKFRAEDGKSVSNMDADSACVESLEEVVQVILASAATVVHIPIPGSRRR